MTSDEMLISPQNAKVISDAILAENFAKRNADIAALKGESPPFPKNKTANNTNADFALNPEWVKAGPSADIHFCGATYSGEYKRHHIPDGI